MAFNTISKNQKAMYQNNTVLKHYQQQNRLRESCYGVFELKFQLQIKKNSKCQNVFVRTHFGKKEQAQQSNNFFRMGLK